jgi:hypothetical protein
MDGSDGKGYDKLIDIAGKVAFKLGSETIPILEMTVEPCLSKISFRFLRGSSRNVPFLRLNIHPKATIISTCPGEDD